MSFVFIATFDLEASEETFARQSSEFALAASMDDNGRHRLTPCLAKSKTLRSLTYFGGSVLRSCSPGHPCSRAAQTPLFIDGRSKSLPNPATHRERSSGAVLTKHRRPGVDNI
uniref:Uncharacterized protein n=1 Tax=Anopheles coluzzii TaxID=1518534 RepID=A0A8W7Q3I0_ANOCL